MNILHTILLSNLFDSEMSSFILKWELFFSEPTHCDEPVAGFLPIQNDQVHFLDVNSDGLIPGINPNQKAMELWSRIEQRFK